MDTLTANSPTLQRERDHVLVPWKKRSGERGPEIVRGDGVYFIDANGRRYLDFTSGFIFNNVGYGEQRIIDAIATQAAALPAIASPFVTPQRAEAAQALAEIAPGDLDTVFFTCGGAESNEAALKFARDITGRPLLVSRYHSFHGATYATITVSRDPRSWGFSDGISDVVYAPMCDPYRCRYAPPGGRHDDCAEHSAAELEDVLLQNKPERIAAIIMETITGSNGLIVPADGYPQRVRELCDKYGILLIADEVMTGFGRTGKWFAVDHYGIVPDIMTVSKGIAGGYVPMGATMVRASLAHHWDEKPVVHGYTFSGYPVGCAAITAAIDVYKEKRLPERSAELGAYLLERARELKEKHHSVGDVRGKGLFVGLELVYDRKTKRPMYDPARPSRGPSPKDRVIDAAMNEGVYIMGGVASVIILAPPLTVTRTEIDDGIAVLDRALAIADREVTAA
jgi:taurine--2-oxoglutarate transaminase